MVPLGSTSGAKKTTQGRKKIEIKKIENISNRQVTFSKRRLGLFKKASELCILSGAKVAILVHSHGKRMFAFGHPKADSVVDRYLNGAESSEGGSTCTSENSTTERAREYNQHYSEVCKELELEKKRKVEIEKGKRSMEGESLSCWWDDDVNGMDVEELELFASALEEMMKNVTLRADELLSVPPNSGMLPALPLAEISNADMAGSLLEDTNKGFDFGSCMPSYGYGQDEQQL